MAKYNKLKPQEPKKLLETQGEALDAILAERPDLSRYTVHIPPQGQQATTVFINDEVFKAPGRVDQIPAFEREASALDHMQGRTSAPIPFVTHIGQNAHFYGMKKMSGQRLTPELVASLPPDEQKRLSADLAGFMLDMQNAFTPEDVKTYDLQKFSTYVMPELISQSLANPEVQTVLGRDLLARARTVEQRFTALPASWYNGVASHGDLKDENLLYDRQGHRLSGILDFGLVGLRSREKDLSKLGNMPRAMLDDIAQNYAAGGGNPIIVDQAVTMFCAAKLCDLDVQVRHSDLKPFVERTTSDLRYGLGNLPGQGPVASPRNARTLQA